VIAFLIRVLAWAMTPAVKLLVARLVANEKSESERADLWRDKCNSVVNAQGIITDNYRKRIAELEGALAAAGADGAGK
jgi:hypothetical protein